MSGTSTPPEAALHAAKPPSGGPSAPVALAEIFRDFLFIGATSFGGGVVAYLHENLVTGRGWLDEKEFLSALEISQTLPGLNAINMSIIVGDRLRGAAGATAAFLGMTIPGAIVIFILGVLYSEHGEIAGVNAALSGVGAAAVGLLLAVTLQLGYKELAGATDIILAVLTCVAVSVFKLSLVTVLLTLAPVAVWIYRPRRKPPAA